MSGASLVTPENHSLEVKIGLLKSLVGGKISSWKNSIYNIENKVVKAQEKKKKKKKRKKYPCSRNSKAHSFNMSLS